MYFKNHLVTVVTFLVIATVNCRNHQLNLENDVRKYFSITTFGFSTEGQLEVNLKDLSFPAEYTGVFGFTLARTIRDSLEPYIENYQKCLLLADEEREDGSVEVVSFMLDPKQTEVVINCSKLASALDIAPMGEVNEAHTDGTKKPHVQTPTSSQTTVTSPVKVKRYAQDENFDDVVAPDEIKDNTDVDDKVKPKTDVGEKRTCSPPKLTYKTETIGNKKRIYDLKFTILIQNEEAKGLYTLFFHNCGVFRANLVPVNLSIAIVERNGENYLSAGEIPLPRLYFFMSFVFVIIGCIWLYVLKQKKDATFKLHYLMAVLVFLKALSLLFHGINYHIIAKDGFPMEAWAVLYYITHLLKGALLFITIVLIGTGWAFIKHVLNDRDKKIFVVFIPLQVLANVAKIIMEESEEGNAQYYYWKEIFILVDLMCCGAILVPVVWSIKHLQEASETDGKAAINLKKLKLFRRFYIMIVCYIYFTRIIVYLLRITVPFQYEWVDELFREIATLIFFILTGYNFRPTSSNPYFRLSQDDDMEMDIVVTQTRFTESVTKTVRSRDSSAHGDETTATKRESSHEYD